MFNEIFRGYRRYVTALLVLGSLSALLDSISIVSIVPLLSFLSSPTGVPTDPISVTARALFEFLHIPFQFRYLLILIGSLIIFRSLVLAAFMTLRAVATSKFLAAQMTSLYSQTLHAKWQFISREKAGHVQNTIFWDVKRVGQLLDLIVQGTQSLS